MPAFRGPDGRVIYVPEEQADRYRVGSEYQEVGNEAAGALANQIAPTHTGITGTIGAAASSALSGATLGASDFALKGLLDTQDFEQLAQDRRDNPVISGVGQVAGAIAPMLLSGGAATPAGALGRLAAGASEGAALGTRLAVAAGEGALQNAGIYLSDVALGDRKLTAEGINGALGTGMLFGAAGVPISHGIEAGTIAARRMFARYAEGGTEAAAAAASKWTEAAQARLEAFDQAADLAKARLAEAQTAREAANLQRLRAGAEMADARAFTPPSEFPGAPGGDPAPAGAAADTAGATAPGPVAVPAEPPEVAMARALRDRAKSMGGEPVTPGEVPPGAPGFQRNYVIPSERAPRLNPLEQLAQEPGVVTKGPETLVRERGIPRIPGVTPDEAELGARLAEYQDARRAFDEVHAQVDPDLDELLSNLYGGSRDERLARAMRRELERPDVLGSKGVPIGEFGGIGQRGFKSQEELARLAAGTDAEAAAQEVRDLTAGRAARAQEGTAVLAKGSRPRSLGEIAAEHAPVPVEPGTVVGKRPFRPEPPPSIDPMPGKAVRKYEDASAILERNKATVSIDPEPATGGNPEKITLRARIPGGEHEGVEQYLDPERHAVDPVQGRIEVSRGPDGQFYITGTSISRTLHGRGLGTALYERMNQVLEEKYGQRLMSDAYGYRTEQAEKLWRRLEERGIAERVGPSHGHARSPERWAMKASKEAAAESLPTSAPESGGAAGRIEVVRVGRPSAGQFEVRMPDGSVAKLGKSDVDAWVDQQLPPGFSRGNLETHRDFTIERGVPASQAEIAPNSLYIVRPSELADRGILGNKIRPDDLESVKRGFADGKRLFPVSVDMAPNGELWIDDGNHRMLAKAAEGDKPIAVQFRPSSAPKVQGEAHDPTHPIAPRLREAIAKAAKTERPSGGAGPAEIPDHAEIRAHEDRADDYLERTVPARAIAERGYYEPPGGGTDAVRVENARKAIAEGQREPIKLTVSREGKILVTDGRHRLAAAIEADAPIQVKWATGTEPAESDVLRHAPAAASATDTLTGQLRGMQAKLGAGEDLVAMGEPARDAYRAAKAERTAEAAQHFRGKALAAREERAAAVAAGETPNPFHATLPDRARVAGRYRATSAPEPHPLDIKRLEMAHDDALERAATAADPAERAAATQEAQAIERQMTQVGARPGAVEDIAALAPAVTRVEKAAAALTEALGDAAPAAAKEHAAAFRAAEDEASRRTTARIGQAADDAATARAAAQNRDPLAPPARAADDLLLGPSQKQQRIAAAQKAQREAQAAYAKARVSEAEAKIGAKQAASAAADARAKLGPPPEVSGAAARGHGFGARAVHAAHVAGYAAELGADLGIPGIPHPHDIPVIGPLLSAYLKYRALRAAAGRFVGRVPATAETRAAALAARTRDGIARSVDRALGVIERNPNTVRATLTVGTLKATDALSKRLVDDGGPDAPAKASVSEQAAVRMREVAAVMANPALIHDAIRVQSRTLTDPDLIDALSNHLLTMFQRLNDIAPKGPPPNPFTGKAWTPPPAEAIRFGQQVAIARDPQVAFQMLEAGTLTPTGAETLRTCYQLLFRDAQQRVIQRATDLKHPVDYSQLVQLGRLFALPLLPSQDPQHAAALAVAHTPTAKPAPAASSSAPTPSIANSTNLSSLYDAGGARRAGRM